MLTVVDDARVQAADEHAAWSESFNEMFAQAAGVFGNAAVRRHGRACLLGLLSHAERKNSWQLAELAGDASPDGMQRLLNFSPWDEDAVRDDLAGYVVGPSATPAAVLVLDETGFLKKGTESAGVARQYTGTAGRIENGQVGVFLGLRHAGTATGRSSTGRCTCPEEWTDDRAAAGPPGSQRGAFATKPELARRCSSGRSRRACRRPGSPATRSTAATGTCGEWLEEQADPYVLAVACSEMATTPAGARRADELAVLVPQGGWQRLSCADGSKGPRLYDWALIGTDSPRRHLLVRRSLAPGEKGELELAYFRCYSPLPVTLPELVAVAGARWGIEDCFAEAKNEAGLDHYQVRKYRAWYRHVTLSMLAHAFLAVTARAARPGAPPRETAAASGNDSGPAKKGT